MTLQAVERVQDSSDAQPERGAFPGAASVIDQLVVDGLVTSPDWPVSFDEVIAPVLGPEWRTSPQLHRVLDALYKDPRCIGFDGNSGFMFKPETSPGSKVIRPSWQAVLARRAGDVPDDYVEEVLSAMLAYTDVVYRRHDNRARPVAGVLPIRELWGMLDWQSDLLTQSGATPNARNFAAFMEFIRLPNNGYFQVLPDQRVVLTGGVFNGNIDEIELLKPVSDMQSAVAAAVELLGPRELAMTSLILRTIEDELGMFTTPAQQAMLKDCMLNIPGVRQRRPGRYRIRPKPRLPAQRAGN